MSECSCAGSLCGSVLKWFCTALVKCGRAEIDYYSHTNAIANQVFFFFYYITSSSFQVKHVYFLCFKLINKHLIYFWTLIEVYSFFNSSMFNILCEHFDGLFYSYLYATLWKYASHHSTTAGSLNPQLLCCLSALVW